AIALLAVGKVLADVSQAGGAKQRVDHRVRQHVGVGMPVQAALAGNLNAADHESPPRAQAVAVIADAGQAHGVPALLLSPRAAGSRGAAGSPRAAGSRGAAGSPPGAAG